MTRAVFPERLRARADRAQIEIADVVADALDAYFRLLAKWNGTINLTALPLEPPTDDALDRLFIEPLAAAHYIKNALTHVPLPVWFDLGSGGGSPAVPLKIVQPQMRLSMVESRSRKAAFLSEVARTLGLSDTNVVNSRFEELTFPDATVDLITVRAVRGDALLTESALRLLNDKGVLAVFGVPPRANGEWDAIRTVQLLPDAESSQLSVICRVPRGTKPLTAI